MAHILAVDDDRDLCELLKTALERDGHQVSILFRGDDVTPQHCAWADCILLDIMMPGEDGFSTCRRIRALADCCLLYTSTSDAYAQVQRQATDLADRQGLRGGARTPFLLKNILESSEVARTAYVQAVLASARAGAEIAVEYAQI